MTILSLTDHSVPYWPSCPLLTILSLNYHSVPLSTILSLYDHPVPWWPTCPLMTILSLNDYSVLYRPFCPFLTILSLNDHSVPWWPFCPVWPFCPILVDSKTPRKWTYFLSLGWWPNGKLSSNLGGRGFLDPYWQISLFLKRLFWCTS